MNQITLNFAGKEYQFSYSHDYRTVHLYNGFFGGYFPFVHIPIACGTILSRSDIVNVIKAKTFNPANN